MDIIVDKFGAFIGKQENRFKVLIKNDKQEYSADDVQQIIVQSPCSISSSAVKLAMEKNIDIVFFNYYGSPYGRIFPCKLGGTTLTRRRQLEASITEEGGILAKTFVKAKIFNQYYFLKSLIKERNSINLEIPEIKPAVKKIDNLKGTCANIRDVLFGIEGSFASRYFKAFSAIIPLTNRDQEGKDIANIAFNYGYGILYSEIERACVLAGLDPYLGFFHTDRYGKPSMVLDLIEPFRPVIVDRAIVTLFVQKQLSETDLEAYKESVILTKDGRNKIADAVLKRLHTEINYKGKNQKFKGVIVSDARAIVRYLLGQAESYKPFIYRW